LTEKYQFLVLLNGINHLKVTEKNIFTLQAKYMQLQCAVKSTARDHNFVTKQQWTTSNQEQVINSSNPLKRTAELVDKVTTKEDQETVVFNKGCIYELQRNKERCFGVQKVDSKLNDLEFNKKNIYSEYFRRVKFTIL
jgi:hypothetical protein